MKKKLFIICMILIAVFGINTNVFAKEDDTCSSTELQDLKKEASNVTATYEYVYNNLNEVVGFKYLVYNIPESMYVLYKGLPTQKQGASEFTDAINIDINTRIGMLYDDNISDTYKITFTVYSSGSCSEPLKSMSVTKPKYNKLSELEQCKYEGLEDYLYCQKWVESDFPYTEEQIRGKIEQQREKNKNKATTECVACKENQKNEDIYNAIVKIRKYAIYGLIAGIVIDLIVIFVLYKKVGEYEL